MSKIIIIKVPRLGNLIDRIINDEYPTVDLDALLSFIIDSIIEEQFNNIDDLISYMNHHEIISDRLDTDEINGLNLFNDCVNIVEELYSYLYANKYIGTKLKYHTIRRGDYVLLKQQ